MSAKIELFGTRGGMSLDPELGIYTGQLRLSDGCNFEQIDGAEL